MFCLHSDSISQVEEFDLSKSGVKIRPARVKTPGKTPAKERKQPIPSDEDKENFSPFPWVLGYQAEGLRRKISSLGYALTVLVLSDGFQRRQEKNTKVWEHIRFRLLIFVSFSVRINVLRQAKKRSFEMQWKKRKLDELDAPLFCRCGVSAGQECAGQYPGQHRDSARDAVPASTAGDPSDWMRQNLRDAQPRNASSTNSSHGKPRSTLWKIPLFKGLLDPTVCSAAWFTPEKKLHHFSESALRVSSWFHQ